MAFRAALKKITPSPIWKLSSDLYWAWRNRGRHVLARTYDSRWSSSQRSLHQLENSHAGERCFIIGNGPSLRQTDLTRLRGEFTFGLNRIYLLFPELGFDTSCLVSVNDLVLEQCAYEMQALNLPRYLTWRARRWFKPDPGITYLDTDFTGEEDFCPSLTSRVFEGFTVTYVALQLAYHMGFQQAVLIGVDHNFVTQGQPTRLSSPRAMIPTILPPTILAKASNGSCPIWLARSAPTAWHSMRIPAPVGPSWMQRSAAS